MESTNSVWKKLSLPGFERPWIGRGRSSNPIQSLIMFSGLFSSSVIDAFTFIISKNMLKKKVSATKVKSSDLLKRRLFLFYLVVEEW